jgi:hypothetical protein
LTFDFNASATTTSHSCAARELETPVAKVSANTARWLIGFTLICSVSVHEPESLKQSR